MFSNAYRMLGSVAEAEDIVQDAFLRMHQSIRGGTEIDSPEAFATTVTTRLAIDALRSARRRREQYIGPWLPEPLVADDTDPARLIEMDETVSIAFLVVLERLSPVERAVFLPREVFAYDYADIAGVVDKTAANCRQILTRARHRIDQQRPRFDPSPEERTRLAVRFFDAVREGDVAGLEHLLAQDVVFYGDGGGKAPAIRHPMYGSLQVARFLVGLGCQGTRIGGGLDQVQANGHPAARFLSATGEVLAVLTLDIVDGHIAAVRNQINPDKLAHLGIVGDLTAVIDGG